MAAFNIFKNTKQGEESKDPEEKLKTDFISLSSHQLRTPLSAIKWFTEILLNPRTGKLNTKQRTYLKEVYRSNERAIALVNDLLHVSRVQEGKMHVDYTEMDLAELVDEVVEANRSLIETNDIKFNLQVLSGPLPKIYADKIKVRRVVQTLLENALKYTPEGGSVNLVLKKRDKDILCSITDTGVGIPSDQQNRVFEKFFRSHNAMRIQPEGTGLGLFIIKALVEVHGGKIWFDSEEGKGTTFYFTIPIKGKK